MQDISPEQQNSDFIGETTVTATEQNNNGTNTSLDPMDM